MNNLQKQHLLAGTIFGLSIALLIYALFKNLESLKYILPSIALLFAIYQYNKNTVYQKKKDTYDYFDKQFYEKFVPLVDEINERMVYFDYFFHLSLEEQLKHKKNIQRTHHFLAELNNKIDNNIFDNDILKNYFNDSFKDLLLSLYLHFDITFLDYPTEVDNLYKKFFDDFYEFEKKRQKQREYFIKYFQTQVADNIKINIKDEAHTLNEWIKKTNLSPQTSKDCSNKEEILHALQMLRKFYSISGLELSLGNLYYICYSDSERAISALETAIKIKPAFLEAYLSLITIKYEYTKNVDEVLEIFNKIPKEIANKDILLHQKASILTQAGRYEEAENVANMISNSANRELSIKTFKKYRERMEI